MGLHKYLAQLTNATVYLVFLPQHFAQIAFWSANQPKRMQINFKQISLKGRRLILNRSINFKQIVGNSSISSPKRMQINFKQIVGNSKISSPKRVQINFKQIVGNSSISSPKRVQINFKQIVGNSSISSEILYLNGGTLW